jgi:hypothetical protein
MAGTFTHFIVCDAAKANRKALPADLRKLLNRHSQFLFLGAVSPDLPYLSFKTGEINWADVMHHEHTNAMAINAHEALKKAWRTGGAPEEIQLVWLMGLVSHLVTDATIHPIVQAIVGRYEENKEEHRICEMAQDSLIYFEIKKMEICYSEFSSILKFCQESPHVDALIRFWAKQTVKAFPDKNEDPDPALWLETYSDAIDAAEGGSSGTSARSASTRTTPERRSSRRTPTGSGSTTRRSNFPPAQRVPSARPGSTARSQM